MIDEIPSDHALRITDGLVVIPYESVCGAPLGGATASVSAWSVGCRQCRLALSVLDERTSRQKERDLAGALWRAFIA